MRSLLNDLGEDCYGEIVRLLCDVVDRTVNQAKYAKDNKNFASFRELLNEEYADRIYVTIMKARRKNAQARKRSS
jgi:hypothetical protein